MFEGALVRFQWLCFTLRSFYSFRMGSYLLLSQLFPSGSKFWPLVVVRNSCTANKSGVFWAAPGLVLMLRYIWDFLPTSEVLSLRSTVFADAVVTLHWSCFQF